MALKDFIFYLFQILTMLYFLDISPVSGERGILSSLYRKAVKDNRPLILVLDNDSYGKLGQKPKNYASNVASSEYGAQKSSDKLYQLISDSLLKNEKASERLRQRRKDKTRAGKKRASNKKRGSKKLLRQKPTTPMPDVIKSLLRISNDLRCAAKDECEDSCPKKEEPAKCEEKCEEKFDCKEEEEPKKDDCGGGGDANECGGDEFISTKGILLETEKAECTRC